MEIEVVKNGAAQEDFSNCYLNIKFNIGFQKQCRSRRHSGQPRRERALRRGHPGLLRGTCLRILGWRTLSDAELLLIGGVRALDCKMSLRLLEMPDGLKITNEG